MVGWEWHSFALLFLQAVQSQQRGLLFPLLLLPVPLFAQGGGDVVPSVLFFAVCHRDMSLVKCGSLFFAVTCISPSDLGDDQRVKIWHPFDPRRFVRAGFAFAPPPPPPRHAPQAADTNQQPTTSFAAHFAREGGVLSFS